MINAFPNQMNKCKSKSEGNVSGFMDCLSKHKVVYLISKKALKNDESESIY